MRAVSTSVLLVLFSSSQNLISEMMIFTNGVLANCTLESGLLTPEIEPFVIIASAGFTFASDTDSSTINGDVGTLTFLLLL